MRVIALAASLLILGSAPSPHFDWGTMRLAEIQNKIQAAHYLRSLNFHIPSELISALAKEQDDVIYMIQGDATRTIDVQAVLSEHVRMNQVKDEQAKKLLIKFIERRAKAGVKAAEAFYKLEQDLVIKSALGEMKVIAALKEVQGVVLGDTKNAPRLLCSMSVTYAGGAASDIRRFDGMMQTLAVAERQRAEIKVRLDFLKSLKTVIDNHRLVTDPQEWVIRLFEAKIIEIAAASMEESTREYLTKRVHDIRKNFTDACARINAIDKDISVSIPQSTRLLAKHFAVVSAVIKTVAQGIRDAGPGGATEAVAEILEYFTEAFDLIWQSAQKMSQLVEKREGGIKGWYGTGVWQKILNENGDIDQDLDASAYGIQIAISKQTPGVCFLGLSDTEYEKIDDEGRRRIVQAACDERILNAFSDAAEGMGGWIWRTGSRLTPFGFFEAVGSLGDPAAFSIQDHQDMDARVRGVARKPSLDARSLLLIARGGRASLKVRGKIALLDAEGLAELRDETLRDLGTDEFIKEAMARSSAKRQWRMAYYDFAKTVGETPLSFTRQQLGNLFNAYIRTGADTARLRALLARAADAQMSSRVTLAICNLEPDMTDVVVEGLLPGEEVPLSVVWKEPVAAPQEKRVRNGVYSFPTAFADPERIVACGEVKLPGGAKILTVREELFEKEPEPPGIRGAWKVFRGPEEADEIRNGDTLKVRGLELWLSLNCVFRFLDETDSQEAFREPRDPRYDPYMSPTLCRMKVDGREFYYSVLRSQQITNFKIPLAPGNHGAVVEGIDLAGRPLTSVSFTLLNETELLPSEVESRRKTAQDMRRLFGEPDMCEVLLGLAEHHLMRYEVEEARSVLKEVEACSRVVDGNRKLKTLWHRVRLKLAIQAADLPAALEEMLLDESMSHERLAERWQLILQLSGDWKRAGAEWRKANPGSEWPFRWPE